MLYPIIHLKGEDIEVALLIVKISIQNNTILLWTTYRSKGNFHQ